MTRARLAPLALAGLLALAPGSRAIASTPLELFRAGNTAYEAGRFDEAADAYEKVLGYGVEDPRVLYNLANADFKLGKLGAAILHYERARRLDPADRDVRDNLEFARGLIRDRVPETQVPYPVQALSDVLDDVPIDLLAGAFLCVYFLAGVLVGVVPLTGGQGRRRLFGYAAAVAGLCALIAGGALAWSDRERMAPHAIVMEDRVDVLSGPSSDNTVLFTVHEGTRLEVRSRRQGWWQVSLPNALSGWVPAASVEQV